MARVGGAPATSGWFAAYCYWAARPSTGLRVSAVMEVITYEPIYTKPVRLFGVEGLQQQASVVTRKVLQHRCVVSLTGVAAAASVVAAATDGVCI